MDELVKRLRASADNHHEKCDGCPYEEDYPCCVDCLDKMHKEAADAIESMSEAYGKLSRHMDDLAALMPRWIPVTERLPEEHKPVLLYNGEGIATGYMHSDKRFTVNGSYFPSRPTHWMPLPEPPKEET